MKRTYIVLIVMSVFLINMGTLVQAAPSTPAKPTDIPGNRYQGQIQAGNQTQFRFRQRTQLRLNSSANATVNIDVDADAIGDKTIDINILNTTNNASIELNITCRQTESELGIQNGQTVRNRNRYRVRQGLTMEIHANASVNAQIGMEMSAEEAENALWAYWNTTLNEWVEVRSSYQNGMLVGETDHFSIWTVVEATPENPSIPLNTSAIIAFSLLGIGAMLLYTKKRIR